MASPRGALVIVEDGSRRWRLHETITTPSPRAREGLRVSREPWHTTHLSPTQAGSRNYKIKQR